MKQHFYQLLAVFLLLCTFSQASGQVTFRDNNTPNLPYNINIGTGSAFGSQVITDREATVGLNSNSWSISVYMPADQADIPGYIEIVPGDDNGNFGSAISTTPTTIIWGSVSGGQKRAGSTGYCDLSLSKVSGYTKVYAVFYSATNKQKLATSPGVLLKFPTVSGGTQPGNGPTTPSNPCPSYPSYPADLPARVYPCGTSDVICGSQCVTSGSVVQEIKGRALANVNDYEYTTYEAYTADGCIKGPIFGNREAAEEVQWQSSTDNINWTNIAGATQRHYLPGPLYVTTYFRRVSTSLTGAYRLSREQWYISNVVKISYLPKPPVATDYVYYACPNSSFTIDFTPNFDAISTNWSLPNDQWTVNGGRGVNFNYSFDVGPVNRVTISVPAGTPAGEYEVHASSNNFCGTGEYRRILVQVGSAPASISGPTSTLYNSSQIYTLNGSGGSSNFRWTLPQGWTLLSNNGSGVQVRTAGYATSDLITVDYVDKCGIPATASLYVSNTSGAPCWGCPGEEPAENFRSASTAQLLYPNPASDEVTIKTSSATEQVTFFDSHGTLRKTVKLKKNRLETQVNVQDLPNGLYHVRIVSKGRPTVQQQLLIQR